MVVFKSLIVFDTETTSLPHLDHNTTKITEFAFIGCEIEHLRDSEELPRVLHKLVIPCNPNKQIHPGASRVSGLTNELLKNVEPLREEDVDFIKHFISRLPPPVCMVAHNGNKFDFPIFRRALEKLNKSLQNNVYCADSLKAFQCLFPKPQNSVWSRRPKISTTIETPINQRTQSTNSLKHKVCRELFPDDEVFKQLPIQDGPNCNDVCSQLFPGHENFSGPSILDDGDDLNRPQNVSSVQPKSCKLRDIYYFYFGEDFPDAHRAEEDSKALLRCIKSCDGFCDWMNANAVIFNSIEPLF